MDEERLKYMEEVLKETKETREKGLKEIKDWATSNLKISIRMEDKYILPFLRGCKFDIDRTKTKITNFHTMKRDRPEWYSNRDPNLDIVKELLNLNCYFPLRQTKADNTGVFINRLAAHDPKLHSIGDLGKVVFMVFDVALQEIEKVHIYGFTSIFDLEGLTFAHIRQFTPAMIQRSANALLNYYCRPQQLAFINVPTFFHVIISMFKSLLPAKLGKRIRVHSNANEAVQQILGIELTPKEYGGNGDSFEFLANYWHQKTLEYSSWLAEDEKYKAH